MENYFARLFEDVRHERSVYIYIKFTDEGIYLNKLVSQIVKLK